MKDAVKVLTHMVFYGAAAASITGMLGWERAVFYGLWTGLLAAGCYLLRRSVKWLWLFLGTHLLLCLGGIAGIMGQGNFRIYAVLLLAVTVLSFLLRLAPGGYLLEEPGYFHIVVLAILYVIASFLGKGGLAAGSGLWGACLLFLFKVFYDNLTAAEEIIASRSGSTRMDVGKLKRQNTRLSLLYVGILAVALAVAGLIRAEGLGGRIWAGIRAFVRFLASLLPGVDVQQEPAPPMEEPPMQDMLEGLGEPSEPSVLMQILNVIAQVVGVSLLVAAVLALVIFIIVKIYRHFYSRTEREGALEAAEPFTQRERIPRRKRERKELEASRRSPAMRIRRLYKKHMREQNKARGISLACLSPKEQLAWTGEAFSAEAAGEVCELYEKARYSDIQVTDKDARRMKILLDKGPGE